VDDGIVGLESRIAAVTDEAKLTRGGSARPSATSLYFACTRVRDCLLASGVEPQRHTCASRLVQAGTPIQVFQQWLGHKSLTITLRYAHVAPANLLAGVKHLEAVSDATDFVRSKGTVSGSGTTVPAVSEGQRRHG
jgi:hypothetical protein